MDVMKRPRTLRLRTKPGMAHPKRVWFFEMLRRLADKPSEAGLDHLPGWFAQALEDRAGELRWGGLGLTQDIQEEGAPRWRSF